MREKIISLELSNAEDEIESITGTGASDAESENEELSSQRSSTGILQEKASLTSASVTEGAASKQNTNIIVTTTKKKKRKQGRKKNRH